MLPEVEFRELLDHLTRNLQSQDGLWTLRGFVDTARNVYSLSSDTKVISKALELMLLPAITFFWQERGYEVVLADYQNFYPDISLVRDKERYALDLKSTYRRSPVDSQSQQVSGFTLGAFSGYFRDRASTKNVTFPYGTYQQHFVIGIVYTQIAVPNTGVFALQNLDHILPPVRDIEIVLQEKWCIASDRPGSGNTRNIGSVTDLESLRCGAGPFARLGDIGQEIFDEYWQNYLNNDMARAAELARPPYRNLREYLIYRNRLDLLACLEKKE